MADITNLVTQNYIRLIQSLQGAGSSSASQMTSILAEHGLTPADFYTWIGTSEASQIGFNALLNANGTVRAYQFVNPQGALVPVPDSEIAPTYNSNLGQATNAAKNRFTSAISANTALNALDFVLTNGTVKKYTPQTQFQDILAFSARILPPVQIASVACRLGKAIDAGLYQLLDAMHLNPPESLNPETWENLVSNDEGELAQAFNWLLALDGEGNAQMYADQESVAYCAQWLNNQDFFATGEAGVNIIPEVQNGTYNKNYPTPLQFTNIASYTNTLRLTSNSWYYARPLTGTYTLVSYRDTNSDIRVMAVSNAPFTIENVYVDTGERYSTLSSRSVTYNNITYYAREVAFFLNSGYGTQWKGYVPPTNIIPNLFQSYLDWDSAYLVYNGDRYEDTPVPGVINNGGPLPDTSTWSDPATTLTSLQQQYPDWFNDKIQVETVQPDGTTETYTYVPIAPVTDVDEVGNPDTQDLAYDYDIIDPTTATLTQLQTIIEALTQSLRDGQTATNPEIDQQTNPNIKLPDGSNENNPNQNDNPPDTGTGNIPPIVLPTGSASSLWAVYHPTQSQLNAFGAWLWSSDFVEQLKRLFNDPMQAVIGVHKVFAPIPTSGSSTIKCGYLDSGVSSAVVSSQYTEVDCGSVNCREYFGNVFDYDPHTKVSIYLPFIGVVPLKVSEVMRSTISVSYGVDVITGACLAKVKVTRDNAGGILYSYGGSCACHYPISSGSYAGIISGIVTSAIGIAGGIVSGNPLAAVGGAMAGLRQAHTEVQRSGGFTGCAGAMGPKKPYLIIDRPQTRLANNFQAFQGKPANSTQFIGDCTGFIRAKEVHFSAPGAFDEEAREIENLLKSGVIMSD